MMTPNKTAAPLNAMDAALSILQGEHAAYAIALKTLVGHLDYARAHADQPKLQIFATGLKFIDTFIDHFHHPKEDEFLFRALRKQTREADDVLCELQFDHAYADSRVKALKSALHGVQSGGMTAFNAFAGALERYTEGQCAHMEQEESVVIPLARRLLAEEDWKAIHRGFRAHRDPLFGAAHSGEFGVLLRVGTNVAR